MDIYIKKRTVHIFLFVLLLLAVSVTVVAAEQQQQFKQSAQTTNTTAPQGYSQPPLYGCLQVGEGTNKGCASKLLISDLKVTLDGQNAEGKTVFYTQTLNAVLKVTNVGDLPIKLQSIAVAGQPLNANYKAVFTPTKQNITLNPKSATTLSGTMHTFNSPDPGGPWKITDNLYDDNGHLVADTASVNVNVNTTCKALNRIKLNQAELNALKAECKTKTSAPECAEYCDMPGTACK